MTTRNTRIPRSVFFLLFTVSGFAGLIYESIWSHYLKLFLGHAAYSQVLVLVIFMGGLAIGSLLAGSHYGCQAAEPMSRRAVHGKRDARLRRELML